MMVARSNKDYFIHVIPCKQVKSGPLQQRKKKAIEYTTKNGELLHQDRDLVLVRGELFRPPLPYRRVEKINPG